MGILNVTPDSFYDGGTLKNDKDILGKVEKMLNEGATFIDVGAYSSRPNADHINEDEELKRIIPVIDLILKKFPKILISVDTFRSKIAKQCIESGERYNQILAWLRTEYPDRSGETWTNKFHGIRKSLQETMEDFLTKRLKELEL